MKIFIERGSPAAADSAPVGGGAAETGTRSAAPS